MTIIKASIGLRIKHAIARRFGLGEDWAVTPILRRIKFAATAGWRVFISEFPRHGTSGGTHVSTALGEPTVTLGVAMNQGMWIHADDVKYVDEYTQSRGVRVWNPEKRMAEVGQILTTNARPCNQAWSGMQRI